MVKVSLTFQWKMKKTFTKKLLRWVGIMTTYTTGNLLDFNYFKENYKLIAIDSTNRTKLQNPQQISFTGKLKNQAHAGA